MIIDKIENWYLNRTQPSFNDVEGVSAIDMVGKNTAKINEIVEMVNQFTAEMESYIKEFTESTNKDYDAFKTSVNQKIVDFIEVVDLKLATQDKEIADSIVYIKENLQTYIVENFKTVINELVDSGKLSDEIMSVFDNINEQISVINVSLGSKANSSDVYSKNDIDTKLTTKANSSDVYTKTEVNELIEGIEIPESGGSGSTSVSKPAIYRIDLIGSCPNGDYGTNEKNAFAELLNTIKNDGYEREHLLCVKYTNETWYSFFRPYLPLKSNSTEVMYSSLNPNKPSEQIYLNIRVQSSGIAVTSGSHTTGNSLYQTYLPKSSTSDVVINYHLQSSVEPTSNNDLTNKQYVDNKILSGTDEPISILGADGSIYLQYSE